MIKRYDPWLRYVGGGDYVEDMKESDDGDYVALDDHESAIAAKDAEIAELRLLIATVERNRAALAISPPVEQSPAFWANSGTLRVLQQIGEGSMFVTLKHEEGQDVALYLFATNNQEVKPNPESVSRDRSDG